MIRLLEQEVRLGYWPHVEFDWTDAVRTACGLAAQHSLQILARIGRDIQPAQRYAAGLDGAHRAQARLPIFLFDETLVHQAVGLIKLLQHALNDFFYRLRRLVFEAVRLRINLALAIGEIERRDLHFFAGEPDGAAQLLDGRVAPEDFFAGDDEMPAELLPSSSCL